MTVVIDGTTGISGVDGTASNPSYEGTDSNTGIFFPAADTIAFSEGGVEVGRFNSSANFQFNSGYGSVATAYGCRAWVNFDGTASGTFAVSSGKWYWEVTVNNTLSQMHGITHATQLTYSAGATNWVGYDATGYAYFSDNGTKYNSNSGVTYGATYGAGDVIGIAFDADNGKLYFSKNGTFQASGDPAAGTNESINEEEIKWNAVENAIIN